MGHYDTQVVCRNGHQITDRLSTAQRQTKHCKHCGAEGFLAALNATNRFEATTTKTVCSTSPAELPQFQATAKTAVPPIRGRMHSRRKKASNCRRWIVSTRSSRDFTWWHGNCVLGTMIAKHYLLSTNTMFRTYFTRSCDFRLMTFAPKNGRQATLAGLREWISF